MTWAITIRIVGRSIGRPPLADLDFPEQLGIENISFYSSNSSSYWWSLYFLFEWLDSKISAFKWAAALGATSDGRISEPAGVGSWEVDWSGVGECWGYDLQEILEGVVENHQKGTLWHYVTKPLYIVSKPHLTLLTLFVRGKVLIHDASRRKLTMVTGSAELGVRRISTRGRGRKCAKSEYGTQEWHFQ